MDGWCSRFSEEEEAIELDDGMQWQQQQELLTLLEMSADEQLPLDGRAEYFSNASLARIARRQHWLPVELRDAITANLPLSAEFPLQQGPDTAHKSQQATDETELEAELEATRRHSRRAARPATSDRRRSHSTAAKRHQRHQGSAIL